MNYLKIIFTILAGLVFTSLLEAQHDTAASLDYVAGPVYKVTNQANGFTVEWNKAPAEAEQLQKISDKEVRVLTPDGKERLIILLNKNGTFSEVIDLAYSSRKRNDEHTQTEKITDFDWNASREFSFANGLKVIFKGEEATAIYHGEIIEVSGSRGRYRIETDHFEAGIAFGPMWDGKSYQYLKEK